MRSKAEILLIVVTFFWGITFVLVKQALADASPLAFIAARFVLAGAFLILAYGLRPRNRRALGPALILGAVLFAGFVFQTWGQEFTTPSKCAFITAFSVILVPAFMAFLGVPLKRASVFGAGFGITGIYLLVAPSGLRSINRGDVLTLIGAAGFAVYIILVGRYSLVYSFRDLAPVQILFVGLLACGGIASHHAWRFHWTGFLGLAIAITAVFSTAFAFAAQNWAQRYVPAAHTALIFALEPVFAAMTSYVVINERLGRTAMLGAAFILLGMVVSEAWGRRGDLAGGT